MATSGFQEAVDLLKRNQISLACSLQEAAAQQSRALLEIRALCISLYAGRSENSRGLTSSNANPVQHLQDLPCKTFGEVRAMFPNLQAMSALDATISVDLHHAIAHPQQRQEPTDHSLHPVHPQHSCTMVAPGIKSSQQQCEPLLSSLPRLKANDLSTTATDADARGGEQESPLLLDDTCWIPKVVITDPFKSIPSVLSKEFSGAFGIHPDHHFFDMMKWIHAAPRYGDMPASAAISSADLYTTIELTQQCKETTADLKVNYDSMERSVHLILNRHHQNFDRNDAEMDLNFSFTSQQPGKSDEYSSVALARLISRSSPSVDHGGRNSSVSKTIAVMTPLCPLHRPLSTLEHEKHNWVSADALLTHVVCGSSKIRIRTKKFGEYVWVWDRGKMVMTLAHYILPEDGSAGRNVEIWRNFWLVKHITCFYGAKDQEIFTVNVVNKGVCHVTLVLEGHCRPSEVLLGGKNGTVSVEISTFNHRERKTYVDYQSMYSAENDWVEPLVTKPYPPDYRALVKLSRDMNIYRVHIGSCTGGEAYCGALFHRWQLGSVQTSWNYSDILHCVYISKEYPYTLDLIRDGEGKHNVDDVKGDERVVRRELAPESTKIPLIMAQEYLIPLVGGPDKRYLWLYQKAEIDRMIKAILSTRLIRHRRMSSKTNKAIAQILIQWLNGTVAGGDMDAVSLQTAYTPLVP